MLEDPARGAGRVQAAGDDLVEQAGEVVVLAERLLQAAAQAERAEREDLAAQVAPPALAQGASIGPMSVSKTLSPRGGPPHRLRHIT